MSTRVAIRLFCKNNLMSRMPWSSLSRIYPFSIIIVPIFKGFLFKVKFKKTRNKKEISVENTIYDNFLKESQRIFLIYFYSDHNENYKKLDFPPHHFVSTVRNLLFWHLKTCIFCYYEVKTQKKLKKGYLSESEKKPQKY